MGQILGGWSRGLGDENRWAGWCCSAGGGSPSDWPLSPLPDQRGGDVAQGSPGGAGLEGGPSWWDRVRSGFGLVRNNPKTGVLRVNIWRPVLGSPLPPDGGDIWRSGRPLSWWAKSPGGRMNLDWLWYRDKPGTRTVRTRNVKDNSKEEPEGKRREEPLKNQKKNQMHF